MTWSNKEKVPRLRICCDDLCLFNAPKVWWVRTLSGPMKEPTRQEKQINVRNWHQQSENEHEAISCNVARLDKDSVRDTHSSKKVAKWLSRPCIPAVQFCRRPCNQRNRWHQMDSRRIEIEMMKGFKRCLYPLKKSHWLYCRSLDEELEVMWPIFSERSPPAAGNATETDDIFNSWNTYEC